MSRDDRHLDRRSVLKAIGSTAAVGAGLGAASSSAAAIETRNRLLRSYSDEQRLQSAFQEHAGGLRRALADEGIVAEDFDFGELSFEIDAEVSGLEPAAQDGLAGVTAVERNGVQTALGIVSASTDTHDLALFVQPELERAYALVEPKAGDERFLATDLGVQPTGDCFYTECTNDCCADATAIEQEWQCRLDRSGNCTDCEITGTSCNCHDCDCTTDLCHE
jgi:hypothetical protein